MPFYVYILFSPSSNRYYVGQTDDLNNRLAIHNAGRNNSTKSGRPWVLKHVETFTLRAQAVARENQIKKKKSRQYIEYLISAAG